MLRLLPQPLLLEFTPCSFVLPPSKITLSQNHKPSLKPNHMLNGVMRCKVKLMPCFRITHGFLFLDLQLPISLIFIWSSPLVFKTLHIQTMCFHRLTSFLQDIGFQASKVDSSLFILHQGALKFYVLIYVDDILLTCSDSTKLDWFLSKIKSTFPYISNMLANSNMSECKPCHTLMSTNSPLSKLSGDPLSNAEKYHQVMFFSKHSTLDLQCFTDSDWGGCPNDRRSTNGYASEYCALANSTVEIMWLQSLLSKLGFSSSNPATLWCDNVGVIYLCSNPVFHARTKHIKLDYHFIREQVQQRNIQVHFISSDDQITDILTKPLGQCLFVKHQDELWLCSSPPST
ncbi:hypothetical protein AAG906_027180 [Vitis piasezkii]